MAEPKFIPQTFQAQSNTIASYDYTDIAEGTGTIIFYGMRSNVSGANTYKLMKTALPATITRLHTDNKSVNFDLSEFNFPKIVKGTGYLSGALYSSGNTTNVGITFKKVSGTAVTSISSRIYSDNATGAQNVFIPVPLTTTHFKKGDILRVLIDVKTAGSEDGFGIDPEATDRAAMKVLVPFKIDL